MEYLMKLVNDNGFIFALIPIIPTFLAFLDKKANIYLIKIRNEIMVKNSIMGNLFADRIMLVMLQILLYLAGVILFAIIFGILIVLGIVVDFDPRYYYVIMLLVTFLLSEFIPKIHNNRKEFINNLRKESKWLRCKNILLFYGQSIIMVIMLIILAIIDLPSTAINTAIIVVIWSGGFFLLINYFNATVKGDRYSHVNVCFNNSYFVKDCPYQCLKVDDPTFITVKTMEADFVKLTKYNKNTIVKIEYFENKKVDCDFNAKLLKRGFVK